MATGTITNINSTRPLSKRIDILYSKLLDQLGALDGIVDAIEVKHDQLAGEMLELERMGIIEARPYLQHGKYLTLVYPTHGGKRRREYIGHNPKRVRDTEEKITNYQKFHPLKRQLDAVERFAETLSHQLNQLIERSKAL